MKVRKRPVEVEAMLWDGTEQGSIPIIHWAGDHGTVITYSEDINPDTEQGMGTYHMTIRTMEGWMVARPGYAIIKGVKNEFYGCEPQIYEETYSTSTGMYSNMRQTLRDHRPYPAGSDQCYCGWRSPISLNDTESDRDQHRAHQVEVLMEVLAR